MKRTTIKLPDDVDLRLRDEARRRGTTISDVTRQAIEEHLGGSRRLLAAAAGRSGRGDISERIEDDPRGAALTALLVDAGPLYAYVDEDDDHHVASLHMLQHHPGPVLVPILVVTEVTYLIASRLGVDAEVRFLGDLASGALTVVDLVPGDWLRILQLVARYADLSLGTVDASVIATAERLGLRTIATFDRRHFGVVRPDHVDAFDLVPT